MIALGQTPRATGHGGCDSGFLKPVRGLRSPVPGHRAGETRPWSPSTTHSWPTPLNMQARYSIVSDHLNAVQGGAALDEEMVAAAAELTGAPAAVIEGQAYQTDGDWASLAALDEVLARSIVTDRWFSSAARLRARLAGQRHRRPGTPGSRGNGAHRAGPDSHSSDDGLHLMRAHERPSRSATATGSWNRHPTSSRVTPTPSLTEAANRGYRFPDEELAQIRQNLTVIENNLGGDLDVADPQRLATVLESVEGAHQIHRRLSRAGSRRIRRISARPLGPRPHPRQSLRRCW